MELPVPDPSLRADIAATEDYERAETPSQLRDLAEGGFVDFAVKKAGEELEWVGEKLKPIVASAKDKLGHQVEWVEEKVHPVMKSAKHQLEWAEGKVQPILDSAKHKVEELGHAAGGLAERLEESAVKGAHVVAEIVSSEMATMASGWSQAIGYEEPEAAESRSDMVDTMLQQQEHTSPPTTLVMESPTPTGPKSTTASGSPSATAALPAHHRDKRHRTSSGGDLATAPLQQAK